MTRQELWTETVGHYTKQGFGSKIAVEHANYVIEAFNSLDNTPEIEPIVILSAPEIEPIVILSAPDNDGDYEVNNDFLGTRYVNAEWLDKLAKKYPELVKDDR